MKKFTLTTLTFALVSASAHANVPAEHPLAKYLNAPGASVNLPVTAAKQSFELDFVQGAYDSFESFHAQMGGDHALYYMTNFSTVMRTDNVNPATEQKILARNINNEIGNITVKTDSEGELKMDDYFVHPTFRHQGVMMIHKGEVVYEAYPGMKPTDSHVWMSSSKTLTGLITAMLAEDGKLDMSASTTKYVPELKGTAWDNVTILDLVNHTAGLNHEESNESILDPEGVFVRFISSALGTTNGCTTGETWFDVLKEVQPLENEKPGDRFRYSSLNTHVLGQVIQNATNKRWTDVAEERIWGKLGARMPLQVHLTPDGTPLNLAIMSSTLEDFAKYATMYTPSWDKVAHEQVVTATLLERIRSAGNADAFVGGHKENQAIGLFGEKPVKGAYQFDFIFEDGAMYKHGNSGQGVYVDPSRDFAAVYFGATPYVKPYGEIKAPAYFRKVANQLANAK
ncbi:Beta-lactamase-related domain-containing protein [Vibrio crassostreae]|uniref:serine hydrolase domain-containing protein n=1 Tax=Vibrio crassostreae TaxID=246167 RepID=UPI00104941BB|nr:serine hydrolase [Vibrio crassostreae]TCT74995.1 CubicO group peptidase (beta-lactamase class C family) [Vibrio crassostreae]CAK1799317.1 Beta-lactamase-related domain-containing protein [Vibrio crassostreae]CAK1804152.1 Beta-lactamase-related domain-containing protein [Vibrio crassostreae]CAK1888174.1 Beta-lactamase-related domain-containing protein [Vibrio crassostreae]CAK1889824.1 Beta-lactamase-related domain-containing protein [Vibrio crassostreae]